MPGRFQDMFKGFFNPKLELLLSKDDLTKVEAISWKNCSKVSDCSPYILAGKIFIIKTCFIFPRPFLNLGSLISVFEFKIFPQERVAMKPIQEALYSLMSNILTELYKNTVFETPMTDLASWASFEGLGGFNRPNYTLEIANCSQEYMDLYRQLLCYINGEGNEMPCSNDPRPCCSLGQAMLRDNFEFFLNYVKFSYLKEGEGFYEKYVKNLNVWRLYNMTVNESISDPTVDMIAHCEHSQDISEYRGQYNKTFLPCEVYVWLSQRIA